MKWNQVGQVGHGISTALHYLLESLPFTSGCLVLIRVLTRILKKGVIESIPEKSWSQN